MADKTLRTLDAGAAITDADLFLSRQGADTVDKSVTGTQVKAYVISQTVTNGVTTLSPSENAVFDAIANARLSQIAVVFNGGGAEIADNTHVFFTPNFAGTITSATLLADQTGSIVVDVLGGTYAGFPTVNSICAAAKPTISSAVKSQDATLTGWTVAFAAGSVLKFNVDSCTTIQNATLILGVTKTA